LKEKRRLGKKKTLVRPAKERAEGAPGAAVRQWKKKTKGGRIKREKKKTDSSVGGEKRRAFVVKLYEVKKARCYPGTVARLLRVGKRGLFAVKTASRSSTIPKGEKGQTQKKRPKHRNTKIRKKKKALQQFD